MPDDTPLPAIQLERQPRLQDMRRLGGGGAAVETITPEAIALEAAKRIHPPEFFAGRKGYASDFLDEKFVVELPKPRGARADDVLPVNGDSGGRLDYMHFSVVMSKARRIAMFTAVNISGKESVAIDRSGDKWFLDGRIPAEAQIGEDLYAGNRLDRGHLVRREDPNWSEAEAEIANFDTFHFTNCSPQMDVVNQKTWLGLENYILQNARAWKDRCTVFTGPVFGTNDLDYRGVLIPKAFWKVVAFLSDDGRPSATAYVVEQAEELKLLEAAFGTYKTYQRSVKQIEKLTGLSFGKLAQFDGFSNEELHAGVEISAELRTLADLRV